jgi:transposase
MGVQKMPKADAQVDANPEAMRQRRETAEHPFATLKMRMAQPTF